MNRPLAKVLFINLLDGQDAHPTRVIFSCGMGILPVLVIFARGLIIPMLTDLILAMSCPYSMEGLSVSPVDFSVP